MWKILNFRTIQILQEINFVDSRSVKTAILVILWALKSVDLLNFSLQKVQKFIKIKFKTCKSVKLAYFELLKSPKLIWR